MPSILQSYKSPTHSLHTYTTPPPQHTKEMVRQAMIILIAMAIIMPYRSIFVAAQTSCTTAIISLAPCLSYISGNSSTPSSSCCSQLSNVVKSEPKCLCMVLNGGGSSIGISINKTQALALPGACKVQTPPVSECNAAGSGGPTTSPAKSPVVAPSSPASSPSTPTPSISPSNTPSTPAAGTAPSADGSNSKNGNSSSGRSNKSVVFIMLSAVIFASCF